MTLCLECDRYYQGSFAAHYWYAHRKREDESEREGW